MLDINSSSYIRFANIFSHFTGYLFTFLVVSFEAQKVFVLMKYSLFIFSLVDSAFGSIAKKPLL